MIDTRFVWRSHGDGFGLWESRCRLRIYMRSEHTVIIASDVPDGGTSITNAAANLATMVCAHYEVIPERLIWIEHYPARPGIEETFDRVEFTWDGSRFTHPRWHHMEKATVEELAGEPV